MLIFHGNAGAAQYRAIYARRITAQGFCVVLHEYPGFGARPGKATLRAALASAHEDAADSPGKFNGIALFTPWESLASLVNEKFFYLPLAVLLRERLDTAATLAGTQTGRHYVELKGVGHNDWFDALDDGDWARLLGALSEERGVR